LPLWRRPIWGSISANGRIDLSSPGLNAPAQRLRLLESLIAKPGGDAHRAHSVMAEDDEVLVGIEFLMSACRNIAHGHLDAAFNARRGELPWFPHINEAGLIIAEEGDCIGRRDLEIEHGSSLVPGRAFME
jgi:hypothetical protein